MNKPLPVASDLLEIVRAEKKKELLRLIESVDGFDIRSGHLTIHFDGNGVVGSVEVHRRYTVK